VGADGLDERAERRRRVDLLDLIGGGDEPPDLAQVDHRLEDAHEGEAIVRLDPRVGSDRGHEDALPLDLRQEEAGQMAQTRLLDRLADDRRVRHDLHLDVVLARIDRHVVRGAPLRQQPAREQDDRGHARHESGQPQRADPPEANHVRGSIDAQPLQPCRVLGDLERGHEEAHGDDVGARADVRELATHDRGVAQRHVELRCADA
jgi:hypothetical protein